MSEVDRTRKNGNIMFAHVLKGESEQTYEQVGKIKMDR
jgi:hypothetical protein